MPRTDRCDSRRTVSDRAIAAEAPICVLVATAELSRFNFIRVVLAILGVRRVERVAGGAMVVIEVERMAPDLILLHDLPPVMDGFAIVNQLRQNVPTASVPVVVFNTGVGGELRRMTLAALCNVLLAQPCQAEDLRAAIQQCVPRYEGGIALPP